MKKKILLADDSRTFLMYIGLLLKRLNFDVLPAENGLEVLKLVKLSEPDLIILDIHMASVDGITVLKYLKDDKQTAHIPVIMASIDTESSTIEKCKRLGCFDFLKKPIRITRLHDAIQDCFFSHKGMKRHNIRASCHIKVVLTYRGKQSKLYSETISEGGIFLRKKEPLPVGSEVIMNFQLAEGETLNIKGEVIYIKELFGDLFKLPPGMAIVFKDISEEETQRLKKYIENLLAIDILQDNEDSLIEQ